MSDLTPSQLTEKACELVQQGDLETARILFEKICIEDANNAEAWMMLGTISGEYFQLNDAIGHLEKALSINPKYIDAYLALAKIQQLKGLQENALVNARRATELDPDSAVAWSTLGNMYRKAGKYEEAVSAIRKAISLNPYLPDGHAGLSEAYLCIGKIRQKSGNTDSAMKHYRCAIEFAPGNAEAYALRGMLHLQQNQINEAESDINRSLAIQPDLLVAIFHHGLIARRSGKIRLLQQTTSEWLLRQIQTILQRLIISLWFYRIVYNSRRCGGLTNESWKYCLAFRLLHSRVMSLVSCTTTGKGTTSSGVAGGVSGILPQVTDI